MARIQLSARIADDIERIVLHLEEHGVDDIETRIDDIITALDVLDRNPLIGRPAGQVNRELIIGRGSRGYVALYRYLEAVDTVFVLAIRSQREAGYAGG
ncbi:MAG: plasmid stabilization protein [Lautropia sp. SCN 70-15]|nr:MAG: plasmid stabilization protein [Lautropia sp. SCN 70-15]